MKPPSSLWCVLSMGKSMVSLGLLLIIVGLLPIWITFVSVYIAAYVDLAMILAYFNQGIFSIELVGYTFTEVMLGLTGLGAILFLMGLRSS